MPRPYNRLPQDRGDAGAVRPGVEHIKGELSPQGGGVIRVRRGGVAVSISDYQFRNKRRWEVRWYFSGRRYRANRSTKRAAMLLAAKKATLISNGATARYRITDAQAWEMEQASEILRPFGKTVLQVAYEEMARQKLVQACPSGPLVADMVGRFIEAKRTEGISAYHLRDLEQRLGKFAGAFKCPVGRLSGEVIETWLNGMKIEQGKSRRSITPRTWNNYRSAVASLFEYSRKAGAFTPGAELLAALAPRRLRKVRPLVYTPAQLKVLLEGATDKLKPALALGAFAGLRSEEVVRLHWSDFNWEAGYILLREHVTKTGRTRQVPISDNLKAWLKPWAGLGSGRVCPYKDSKSLSGMKYATAERLGVKWQRNALRKSWISYQVALSQDVAKVASQAGNSAAQIHQHYLDLVTPGEARAWFSIHPATLASGLLNLKFR